MRQTYHEVFTLQANWNYNTSLLQGWSQTSLEELSHLSSVLHSWGDKYGTRAVQKSLK